MGFQKILSKSSLLFYWYICLHLWHLYLWYENVHHTSQYDQYIDIYVHLSDMKESIC